MLVCIVCIFVVFVVLFCLLFLFECCLVVVVIGPFSKPEKTGENFFVFFAGTLRKRETSTPK